MRKIVWNAWAAPSSYGFGQFENTKMAEEVSGGAEPFTFEELFNQN